MKYLGLDFETANGKNGSIISIGICCVNEDNEVELKYQSLIKPHPTRNHFMPHCTGVHGIYEQDVRHSPILPKIFPEVRQILNQEDSIVVCHNAAFDIRHLRHACELYELEKPSFKYICTYRASKAYLPNLENHKLSTLAEHYNIEFDHHDALSDAFACAQAAAYMAKAGMEFEFKEFN